MLSWIPYIPNPANRAARIAGYRWLPSRLTTLNAIRPAKIVPENEIASDTVIQIHSCRCVPNSAAGAVTISGSGFHDGAPARLRLP